LTALGGLGSSFTEFLAHTQRDLLPDPTATATSAGDLAPHATTIVAVTCPDGVVIAGDRRATMGSMIAQRDIEKVYMADDYTAIGIAGSAGLAIDLVKLFRVELEHYEKIEGFPLTIDGKAHRLATMIRGNLGLAMQGFVVVPLFVGWDLDRKKGRIFSYDATGGCYEAFGFHSVGSGSVFARGSLKKLHDPKAGVERAVQVVVEALFDAADDDSATGGPDVQRRIYPIVMTATANGVARVSDDKVAEVTASILERRQRSDEEARR
jgi:proteasome beta subunit